MQARDSPSSLLFWVKNIVISRKICFSFFFYVWRITKSKHFLFFFYFYRFQTISALRLSFLFLSLNETVNIWKISLNDSRYTYLLSFGTVLIDLNNFRLVNARSSLICHVVNKLNSVSFFLAKI